MSGWDGLGDDGRPDNSPGLVVILLGALGGTLVGFIAAVLLLVQR